MTRGVDADGRMCVQLYMQAEDWLNAIQSLNVALKLDPAHAALHDQLGEGTFGCALGYGKERKVRLRSLACPYGQLTLLRGQPRIWLLRELSLAHQAARLSVTRRRW